ncbi:MFS transporter [Methylobacterium planeticum]|uniref:MFS transporter n=1 Tax=Methylobacterium planeticum TaxID=2615211 RepID=UPI001FED8EA8|nr:MFS transporter [Methylobacterium planeticum]
MPRPRFALPTLKDRRARYGVFFATYFYQGLVAGFSLTALANHLAGQGVPASEVGLHFALAGLPWTLQPILWGPLVDRAGGARMGRRRVWVALAFLGSQIALTGLLLVPGAEALGPIGIVFLLHSLFASLLDTACDRLIMDHVPEGELGRMSACTRAGFIAGTSLSAALFAWTLSVWGFGASVRGLIGVSLLATLPVLLIREAPGDALVSLRRRTSAHSRVWPFRRFLKRLGLGLRRPSALRLLALCFGIDASLGLFELRFGVDLVQAQGWDPAGLSRLQAALALASGTVGALVVGFWSDRAGPLASLWSLLAVGSACFAVAAGLIAGGLVGPAGPLVLGLTTVLPGLVIVALVPALMRASRGRAGAATQFEVFMAAMNLGSVAGGAASGPLAPVLPLAFAAGLVALVFLGSAVLVRRPALILPRGPVSRGSPAS